MTRALLLAALLSWIAAPAARAQIDLDLDVEGDAGLDADVDADASAELDVDGDTDSESEPDVDSESDADPDSDPDSGDDSGAFDDVDPAAGEGGEPTRAVRLRSAAGVGFGTLSYERPTGAGVETLAETPFGAADVLIGVHAWPDAALSLDTLLAYQTSIGMSLELGPLYGLPVRAAARFQRGELSFAPVLKLGEGTRALSLALPIGFVAQFFEPTVHHLSLERYSLGGPNARLELRAWLGERVSVRLGPEAQWIVHINGGLADEGACCQGFAIGGQGGIEAAVGPHFRASLAYRETRAFAPAGAWRFKSVERFLTARIAGEL